MLIATSEVTEQLNSLCQGVTDNYLANSNYIFMLTGHESTNLTKCGDREAMFLLLEFEFLKGNYVPSIFVPGAKYDPVRPFLYLIESLITVYGTGRADWGVRISKGYKDTMSGKLRRTRSLRRGHLSWISSPNRLCATFEGLLVPLDWFGLGNVLIPFGAFPRWSRRRTEGQRRTLHLEQFYVRFTLPVLAAPVTCRDQSKPKPQGWTVSWIQS